MRGWAGPPELHVGAASVGERDAAQPIMSVLVSVRCPVHARQHGSEAIRNVGEAIRAQGNVVHC